MPRGRKPEGENVLTNAERQARHRARRQALHPPVTITHRPATDRRSRPWRWRAAVAELLALQAEYAAWCNALPDSLRDSVTAQALTGDRRSRPRRPRQHPAAAWLRP
jgi:hypothetical protein